MATCPSCGRENPEGFAFCGFCTAPLFETTAPSGTEELTLSALFVLGAPMPTLYRPTWDCRAPA